MPKSYFLTSKYQNSENESPITLLLLTGPIKIQKSQNSHTNTKSKYKCFTFWQLFHTESKLSTNVSLCDGVMAILILILIPSTLLSVPTETKYKVQKQKRRQIALKSPY